MKNTPCHRKLSARSQAKVSWTSLTRSSGRSILISRGEQMAKTAQAVNSNLELFPILSQLPSDAYGSPLTGIARLAAASSPAGEGHQMELRSLPVRSMLNRSVSRRGLRFAWSINPYRGCEFACRYCYARYTHEFMELPPEDFERKDLHQAERSLATGAGIEAGSPGRRDRPGHRYRPLSTRRTPSQGDGVTARSAGQAAAVCASAWLRNRP